MISAVTQMFRLWRINTILARYRLDEIAQGTPLYQPLHLAAFLTFKKSAEIGELPVGKRLRLALQEMGPVYVKFGQILSTRRDLLPAEIADELSLLQDRVPPFPGAEAQAIIEKALGAPVAELFSEFEVEPLASASIAQVHGAVLHTGEKVVVKVVRPGIRRQLVRDLEPLKAITGILERYWHGGSRVRPLELVKEFESVIYDELDMQREAANASLLKRNFKNSNEVYIPTIYWSLCKDNILVMERVEGIPVGDIKALKAAGVDLQRLAVRGVRMFYTQVFRDNLFHADLHPGNILIDATNPADASYILLDYGIVASLSPQDLYYISENFIALFNQNYRRVADLHIEAGWVPATTRIDELEAAVRTVGESSFSRPLNEISFGHMLLSLFRVARRFQLTVQPQLIMLQKTMLNIEGLGRQLYPDLDIWAVAKPELESIMREKYGIDHTIAELRERLPTWLSKAPEMPGLIHDYLNMATRGELRHRVESQELQALKETFEKESQRNRRYLLSASLAVVSAVFLAMETGPWTFANFSVLGLLAAVFAIVPLLKRK
ncbi:MAG: ubiquinone biosynthesis regulatory protein kinase UbiB [Xanthomonadales bacterium]|nr:ubiquinone biosynthesis regulatory protein kinase UbiB [Xanthomonadales bacterium]